MTKSVVFIIDGTGTVGRAGFEQVGNVLAIAEILLVTPSGLNCICFKSLFFRNKHKFKVYRVVLDSEETKGH